MDSVVIIPVHNQLDFVKKSIQSIILNTPDLRLIVVDDASSDGVTSAWLRDNKAGMGYDLIVHEKSCGFSKTANDGIDFAFASYSFNCLCVINSDTEIVTKNWFRIVEYGILHRKRIGIAGVISNNAGLQSMEKEKFLARTTFVPALKCDLVHGFCLFFSANLLREIPHYDHETFPNYASDYDFCLRSLQAGFTNIVVGSVYVEHHGKASEIKDDEVLVKNTLAKKMA